MKYRTTKKEIRNCGSSVYKVGYCKVQFEWACFIDSLCKSGEITQKQYNSATF